MNKKVFLALCTALALGTVKEAQPRFFHHGGYGHSWSPFGFLAPWALAPRTNRVIIEEPHQTVVTVPENLGSLHHIPSDGEGPDLYEMSVPGHSGDDVKVWADDANNTVHIKVSGRHEESNEENAEGVSTKYYSHRSHDMEQSFRAETNGDLQKMRFKVLHGLLTITIPKKTAAAKSALRAIEMEID